MKAINCEVTGCQGHALLPGGELLIIDGKRLCWEHAAKAKKQKDRCIRVPATELQAAMDLVDRGIGRIPGGPGLDDEPSIPEEFRIAREILNDLLTSKGVYDA